MAPLKQSPLVLTAPYRHRESGEGSPESWDLARGRELVVFHTTMRAAVIDLSPDGRRLVTQQGERASLWDTSTGSRMRPCPESMRASWITFSRDGRLFLTRGR